MEGFGGFFNDPDFQKRLQEMAEQMQSTQNLAWADNAIKLAVDMTVAAINRVNLQGSAEDQAKQVRSVMATIFPEAVTLVREARQGLSRRINPIIRGCLGVVGAGRRGVGRAESVIELEPTAAAPPARGAALCDDLLEGADVEDEDECPEAHAEVNAAIAICCRPSRRPPSRRRRCPRRP